MIGRKRGNSVEEISRKKTQNQRVQWIILVRRFELKDFGSAPTPTTTANELGSFMMESTEPCLEYLNLYLKLNVWIETVRYTAVMCYNLYMYIYN